MTGFQLELSAQAPWTSTMVGRSSLDSVVGEVLTGAPFVISVWRCAGGGGGGAWWRCGARACGSAGSGAVAGHRHVEAVEDHADDAVAGDEEHELADAVLAEQLDRPVVRGGRERPSGGERSSDVVRDRL